jgi:hypothetical protein
MSEEKGLTINRTTIQIAPELEESRERTENFLKKMHQSPAKSTIKVNKFAGNSSYLGVSQLEMEIDKFYLGIWNFIAVGTGSQVLVNSVTYDGILEVFHPVLGIWIKRAGTGAVPIQIVKETGLPQDKSIQKAVGAAKSMAFKNACKSLGKRFGRDLNRIAGEEADYERFYTQTPINE